VYAVLQAYSWPGNVRQLENVVQRLVFSSRHETIAAHDVPSEIRREASPRLPAPRVERRRSVADELFTHLEMGESFWDVVHRPYLDHEITKADLREIVRKGLQESHGSYRVMTKFFGIDRAHYRRFLSFLRKQQCLLPFREYR
jgi:DNA-binding NtrC family response regulator